jgi:large subunit ribosomal protein L16
MLMPKKTKYRKVQRGRMKGLSKGARKVDFGEFGICAQEPCWMSSKQIEAMRVALSRNLKKQGKYFLRVFPDKPVSKKPLEVRMGGGKPGPEFWVCVVKRGRVIAEISGVSKELAQEIFKSVAYKLPIKVKFVEAENSGSVVSTGLQA